MDVLGRYTLKELRDYTRRLMDNVRFGVSDTTGLEDPSKPIYETSIGDIDVTFALQAALTASWCDVVLSSEDAFTDYALVTTRTNIVEYPWPDDFAILRELRWLPRTTATVMIEPPSRRIPMKRWDSNEPFPEYLWNGAPSFRLNIDGFVLNETSFVRAGVVGKIEVKYIKHVQPLDPADDEAVIETQFATIIQHLVVRRAAKELLTTRNHEDTTSLDPGIVEWTNRLSMIVRNIMAPTHVDLVTRPVLSGQFGRRRR